MTLIIKITETFGTLSVVLMLLLMVTLPAMADDFAFDNDELAVLGNIPSVFSASKYEQKLTEAPSSISIITAEEIRKAGYRTLSDVLKSVRGFYISSDHSYDYIGMRGFNRPGDYNSRMLLLIDGVRMNDGIYGTAQIGTELPLDLDLIDRIEIVRGPTSSLYGSNAFMGTINVFTKRGRDIRGVEAAAFAGDNNLLGGRLSYGQRYSSGLEVLMSGSLQEGDGADWYYREFDDPYYNDGRAEGIDTSKVYNLFFKASLIDFVLTGTYNHRDDGYPTAPWGTEFNNPDSVTLDEYLTIALHYDRTTASLWDISGKLIYNRYYYEGYYPYDWADYDTDPDAEPFILNGYDEALSEDLSASLQFGRTVAKKHRILIGGEFRDSFTQKQKYYHYRNAVQPPGLGYDLARKPLDSSESNSVGAGYLQDEYKINDQWILNAGIRLDYYSNFGTTINPRLALIYSPREVTTFKWLYGTAFRAPTPYELHYEDGETMTANPDLKPEDISTFEFIWEERLTDSMLIVVNGFYYEVDEMISQATIDGDLLQFQNIDRSRAYGFEFALEGTLFDKFTTNLSYTFAKTENRTTGKELSNSPRHLGKLNVGMPLWNDKFFLYLEELYTSSRLSADLSERIDAFWITNLTLSTQPLVNNLRVSLSLYNLFDKTYYDPGSLEHEQSRLEQHGRQFFLKTVYSF